jgi:hypothetical protein
LLSFLEHSILELGALSVAKHLCPLTNSKLSQMRDESRVELPRRRQGQRKILHAKPFVVVFVVVVVVRSRKMSFANVFKNLSCELFAIVYSQLCLLQLQSEFVSFEEIVEAVRLVTVTVIVTLSDEDIQDYAGIIFEATLKPIYVHAVGGKFGLKSEIINSEEKYFKEIIKTLEEKKVFELDVEPLWNNFLRDVDIYLRGSRKTESAPPLQMREAFATDAEAVSYNLKKPFESEFPYFQGSVNSTNSSSFNDERVLQRFPEFMQQQQAQRELPGFMQHQQHQHDRPPQKMHSMRHEGIQRLMNYFRKGGMDLIFPPVIHEKVKLNHCISLRKR